MADDRDKLDLLPPQPRPAPVAAGAPPTQALPAEDLLPPSSSDNPPATPGDSPEQPSTIDVRIDESQTPPRSSAEKAQRRTQKNLLIFGVCIVVLVIVFYLLTR
jgi:hypothetical protein